jgi:hypothetical protein
MGKFLKTAGRKFCWKNSQAEAKIIHPADKSFGIVWIVLRDILVDFSN